MRRPTFVIISLLLASSTLTACAPFLPYSYTYRDEQKDQPWVAPGIQPKTRVRVKGDFVRLDQSLVWIAPDGREFDADQLVGRCEDFLASNGLTRKPTAEDFYRNPVPAERYDEGGYLRTASIYPDSPVIVCAEPLIVLVCDEPKRVTREEEFPGVMDKDGEWFVTSVRHTLQHGYQRGTAGHCSRNLRWFSPDLNIGPEPLQFSPDGMKTITTPWGVLEIAVESGQWTATAKTTADGKTTPK